VAENFNNPNNWIESTFVNFYKYFADVTGRRVKALIDDPDIQCQAYVDGTELYILLHNVSEVVHPLDFDVPTNGVQSITLRRFGRAADFKPYFTEGLIASLNGLQIEAREALAMVISYATAPVEQQLVNEIPHYGDLMQQQFSGGKIFKVVVPEYQKAQYATLRVGVGRDSGTDNDLVVQFNGTPLEVPMEDAVDRLDDGAEYGSTKLVQVPVHLLQATNNIGLIFSGAGGVGSVVIRAAIDESTPVLEESVSAQGPFTEVAGAIVDTQQQTITVPMNGGTVRLYRVRSSYAVEITSSQIVGSNLVLIYQ
jgi:hypothetical protein